jgi:hypothetical protein
MDKVDKGAKIGFRRRHVVAGGLVAAIAGGVSFVTRRHSEWQDVYVRAGRHLRMGEAIYHAGEGYVYPPFMAAVAMPFDWIGRHASLALWYGVNLAAAWVVVAIAWRLAKGARETAAGDATNDATHFGQRHSRREDSAHGVCGIRSTAIVFGLGAACGVRYLLDNFTHQQTDGVIAALMLAGCGALASKRTAWATVSFGITAAMKGPPLLWCGYFSWRGKWLGAIGIVSITVILNLVPDFVSRTPTGGSHMGVWFQTCVSTATATADYPYSEQIYNQSLSGAVSRWATTRWRVDGNDVVVEPRAEKPSYFTIKSITSAAVLVIVASGVLCMRRARRTSPRDAIVSPRSLEFSIVMIAMVLLSPMSSKPHFCTLLLPGFCLARLAVIGRERIAGIAVAGSIGAGLVGTNGLFGDGASTLALWYGNVTWSALFLFAGCAYALASRRVASSQALPSITYPLMTPMGRMRATRRESPARSTTSTTSSTFL